jgi:hypothetical protein
MVGSRVIVIDNPYSIQLLTSLYRTRVVLLAQNPRTAADVSARLFAARVPSFTLLSRSERPALSFPPFTLRREFRDGRLVVQEWRR